MSANENYRDDPPDRWPPDFATWPLDAQIKQVAMRMTRKGLIDELLTRAQLPHDQYELRDDSKLTKKELAAIYLTLEGINNGSD